MADYSIFVMGESQLSTSLAQGLDGLNQGDGSHLIGQTITIDTHAATEVFIRDGGNDANFADNDSNQRLDGDQTIDGTLFTDGTRVEAEYGITLTDGVNTYQAVAFNVNNSSPSYATVEGIAFIGGPGEFPPAGVELQVVSTQEGPSFAAVDYVTPICYRHGTLIRTDQGDTPIETLKPGDVVWTQDDGFAPVRWVGSRDVIATGRFRMVEIPTDVLTNFAPLMVSQQHRLLVTHPLAELHFGVPEVFVPAISLVDSGLAGLSDEKTARYHHLLLDRHAVIKANGAASESLLASPSGASDDPDALFFPDLAAQNRNAMQTARLALKRRDATFLMQKILSIDPVGRLIHTSAQTEWGDRSLRAGKNEARA
ncbi:Hint domain-containing protein [Ruegeria arenilitoris]|uniref:Hint domain-containing protein n=1 Tax=Ruegeria arenilitoris TaxID=1173585 RepID=UPI0014809D3E|nr:Hint domain-containing protein [Ruegeria arenilitoris]